jgi:hypothetical protein
MFYRNKAENGPLASSPSARSNRGLSGTKAVGAGALVALAVMAVPAIANASGTTEIKITVSGGLSGTLAQSPVIGCMDGASPYEAIFALSGTLKGGEPNATWELVAETGAKKPGTWTKFYPKSAVHLGFSESAKTNYGWVATTGKLTEKAHSGTIKATFVSDGTPKGHALFMKASWSC